MFHSLLKHSARIQTAPRSTSPRWVMSDHFGRVGSWCPGASRVIRGCGSAPSDLPGETTELCPEITPPWAFVFLGLSSSEALSLENQQSPLPERAAGCLVAPAVWRPSRGPLGRGPLGSQGQVTGLPPARGLRASPGGLLRGFSALLATDCIVPSS